MPGPAARLLALLKRLWSPALLAYAVTGSVAVASFASTLLLARMSGAAVIGQYALAITTANLMVVFALQGLDRILIREIAGDLREGNSGRARGTLRHAIRHVAGIALLLASALLLLLLLTPFNDWLGGNRTAMLLVPLFVVVTVVFRFGIAGVRATGAPLAGQMLEALPTIALPLIFLPLWLTGGSPGAATATGILTALHILAGFAALLALRPIIASWAPASSPPPGLVAAGLPLMTAMFFQLFSDWFILAQLSASASPADAGAYRVVAQIITIFLTIITTSESYVAARVAGDFRVGRPDLAWARHHRASVLMMVLAGPLLLVCLVAPRWLLETAFGPEFGIAATALTIMAAVQIVHVGRGPLGAMLTMAGRDDIQLKLTIAGLAAGTTAALILIPRYGLTGAAVAQALPLFIRSAGSYLVARHLIPRTRTQPMQTPELPLAERDLND